MRKIMVYFAHGKESGPWGKKISMLVEISKELGCLVDNPDYSSIDNPDERVSMFLDSYYNDDYDIILVGSSMGGYLSVVASEKIKLTGLFLLAPALYLSGYNVQSYQVSTINTVVIHGWNDVVVPIENSIRFCSDRNAELHILDSDHRLNDVLDDIEFIYRRFIEKILANRKAEIV